MARKQSVHRPTPWLQRRPTLIAVTPRVRWFGVILGLIALVWLLHAAPSVLAILLGGFTLALILSFPIQFLERYMARGLAILLTFLGLFGLIALAAFALVPALIDQLTALIADAPALTTKANQLLTDFLKPFQERGWLTGTPEDLINQAQQAALNRAQEFAQTFLTFLLSWVKGALNLLLSVVGSLFIAVYMLLDTRKLKATFLAAAPKRYRTDVAELWEEFARSLSRYIAGLFVVIIVQGVASAIALSLLGIPYAIVLGAWVSATAILPMIGAWLGAIPAVVIAAFISPFKVVAVIVVYVLLQQLEGNLLTPKIQGQALKVHAILIFLAVIAGGEIAGLPGALLAVPALAILRVLFDFFRHRLRVVEPMAIPDNPPSLITRPTVIIEEPVVVQEVPARNVAAPSAIPTKHSPKKP